MGWWKAIGERVGAVLPATAEGTRLPRAAVAVACVVILAVLFSIASMADRYVLEVGDVAPRDIKAPREFVDLPRTQERRQQAAAQVSEQYELDRSVDARVRDEMSAILEGVAAIRQAGSGDAEEPLSESQQVEELRALIPVTVADEVLRGVLRVGDTAFQAMADGGLEVLNVVMDEGIKESALPTYRNEAAERVRGLGLPPLPERFMVDLVQVHVAANLLLNEQETLQHRAAAMENVEPVRVVRGEVIVREGQRLAADDVVRLRDAGLLQGGVDVTGLIGVLLASMLIVGVGGLHLSRFHADVYRRTDRLSLVGVVGALMLAALALVWPAAELAYLVPLAAGPMLLTILLHPGIGVLAAVLLAAAVGIMTGGMMGLVLVTLVGGLVAAYTTTSVAQRSEIIRAGLSVSLANVAALLAYTLATGDMALGETAFAWQLVYVGLHGVLAAVVTTGLLPFFESYAGIVTAVKLLELSNPNHPLLRRMLVEAPGTYHHSLMVANLAEAASEEVGADSLLVRVGCYYHDIGKMKRPYFFIENQFGGENPHDEVKPGLSALIITAHVRDGVEMAREHRLPEEIIDFIREHHGTTLVQYFYERAKEGGEAGSAVLEENFRYDGPIPQSRETAIALLADSCEAAVRSLRDPSPARIESLVRSIARDRLESGQLDQSDLTLTDLDAITRTFTRILSGVFHARVEYPEAVMKEIEAGNLKVRRRPERHLKPVPPRRRPRPAQGERSAQGEDL